MDFDTTKLNELANDFDLLGYVSESLDVEKRGTRWATHCPFHEDKTPSLMFSEHKYKCYSCGKSGNIITWLMDYEGYNFNNAVDRFLKINNMSGEDIGKTKQCYALKFFKKVKQSQQKKDVEYKNRKILDVKEIQKYHDVLPQSWIEEGIKPDIMKKYNIRMKDWGFDKRIIYPIWDKDFNLIAFKGRTIYDDYKEKKLQKYKYIGYIDTLDFFVGMKENKDNIIQNNEAIIVEGIKSVMKLEDYGYTNAISAETSELTDLQQKILLEMRVKNIVIAFDKGININQIINTTKLLRKFLNVYVVMDTDGLLDDKDAPVDRGKDVWDILYEKRRRLY